MFYEKQWLKKNKLIARRKWRGIKPKEDHPTYSTVDILPSTRRFVAWASIVLDKSINFSSP
ncbi:MAG: hypothetical protein ACI9LM_005418 [Alteromonadaceae bacterium]|jgi:hypothetical protein